MSKTGKFLGIPYDWRRPTWTRVKQRWWNPSDRRVLTPKSYCWDFDINLRARPPEGSAIGSTSSPLRPVRSSSRRQTGVGTSGARSSSRRA